MLAGEYWPILNDGAHNGNVPNPTLNVTIDLMGWLGDLQRDLDALLRDLMEVCRAADDEKYSEESSYRFGAAEIVLPGAPNSGQHAAERAARSCFLGAIGKFISFLDKLIASRRVTQNGMRIDRPISSQDDLNQYIQEYMASQIANVAGDQSLNNPKKIECFPRIQNSIRDAALAYFSLRRTMEHHQDIPAQDLIVPFTHFGIFIGDKEIVEFPMRLEAGEQLLGGVVTEHRKFPAGMKVILSPKDAYGIVFPLRNMIAPEIFRVHIEPAEESVKAS
jgi:hypothetical protein